MFVVASAVLISVAAAGGFGYNYWLKKKRQKANKEPLQFDMTREEFLRQIQSFDNSLLSM